MIREKEISDVETNESPMRSVVIERLYEVFTSYTLAPDFPARCSPLGDRQEIASRLQASDRRSAGAADLAVYAFKARFTMGGPEDFKYFLPRLLEVYADDPEWHGNDAGDGTIFVNIRDMGWSHWPEVEREAVRKYILWLWRRLLVEGSGAPGLRDFCRGIDALGIDYGSLLENVGLPRYGAGLGRLAELVRYYLSDPRSFGESRSAVDAWLRKIGAREALESAYLRCMDEELVDELAAASDLLFWMRP